MAPAYVPARWQHSGRGKAVRAVCMHVTVSKELGTGAEQVARYFQTTDRKGSSHLVGDNNSVVRCVNDWDTAFGAAGLNADGLHYELVGMPDQTAGQWADDFSLDELELAAAHVAAWCLQHAIPARWLTVAQLRDGVSRGLTTHADVEAAFPSTGHWDPGPNFPRAYFLARVQHHMGQAPPAPPSDDGGDETMVIIWKDSKGGYFYNDTSGPVFFALAKKEEADFLASKGAVILWAEDSTVKNAAASCGVHI